jgi:hypothetical protein
MAIVVTESDPRLGGALVIRGQACALMSEIAAHVILHSQGPFRLDTGRCRTGGDQP